MTQAHSTPTVLARRAATALRVGLLVLGATVAAQGASTFPRSPFNARVTHPVVLPESAGQLDRVLGDNAHELGRLQFATVARGVTDTAVPVYTAHESDPHYRIHCMRYTNCPLEGASVAIPRGAKAEANLGNRNFEDDGYDDRHIAVRNVDTHVEDDLWLAPEPSGHGGTLNIGYGGRFPFASGGVGHGGATAAGFALSLGRIRAQNLVAGRIPFALFLTTPCENGHVAPATGDDGGHDAGCPPIGARLWLDTPVAQIERSGATRDARVILRALHEYGGFIGDRCTQCTLKVALAGGLSETAMGRRNPWASVEAHYPNEHPAGRYNEYHIPVDTGSIDLHQHLHIIAWP